MPGTLRLSIARDDQVRRLSEQTHVLWGGGLDDRAYLDLWLELSRTPWARRHASYRVLETADGTVLSSLKLYRPLVRWGGRTTRAGVVAGVFTPSSVRRRGHATELLRRVAAEIAAEVGDVASDALLLFSDIGTRFYRSLGFRPLAAREHWLRLSGRDRSPDPHTTLRPLEDRDLPKLVAAHRAYTRRRPFAIERDDEHWEFVVTRARGFFRRLAGADSSQRLAVIERNGAFLGYAFSVESGTDWNLREFGAVDGDPATLLDVARHAIADAAGRGMRRGYAWLPPEVVGRAGLRGVREVRRRRMVPMLRPIGAGERAAWPEAEDAFLFFQDQF